MPPSAAASPSRSPRARHPDCRTTGGSDFNNVTARRACWLEHSAASSEDADEIYRAVETLIVDDTVDERLQLGVRLATVAARLPHGGRTAFLDRILGMVPRRQRARLVRNRILSGEALPTAHVEKGIRVTMEAAKKEAWILIGSNAWELREWLQLLPFTDDPSRIAGIVRSISPQHRPADRLEDLVAACANSPSPGCGDALFELAALEPKLYANYAWRTALLNIEDPAAFARLAALIADGHLGGGRRPDWSWARNLGKCLNCFPELRRDVYARLRVGIGAPGIPLLAGAVAEAPDADGILLLVELEQRLELDLISSRTVELAVTGQVPSQDMRGAYEIVPVAAPSLRRQLLAMTRDGGLDDRAARALALIDTARDEHGPANLEPRHPDLASKQPWIGCDTDVCFWRACDCAPC